VGKARETAVRIRLQAVDWVKEVLFRDMHSSPNLRQAQSPREPYANAFLPPTKPDRQLAFVDSNMSRERRGRSRQNRGLQIFARHCDIAAVTDGVLARVGRPFPVEPIRMLSKARSLSGLTTALTAWSSQSEPSVARKWGAISATALVTCVS
jgi:hypothetical protein